MGKPSWKDYHLITEGGTPVKDSEDTAKSKASIEFGTILNKGSLTGRVLSKSGCVSAGEWLQQQYLIENNSIIMPIGIDATDKFFSLLENYSNHSIPDKYTLQRGRLVDSYIDSHKYVFGKKALIYGEEDLVIALCSFLSEIGIQPAIVASGGESGVLKKELISRSLIDPDKTIVMSGADFESMRDLALDIRPDILIGNSKGYYIARELEIPIVRVGFPIHDRVGGPRLKHLCYEGTQELFDRIVNALLEYKQEHSPIGYKYM